MNNDPRDTTQGTPINTTGTQGYTTNASGDVVVPEYEEQLVAEKVARQEGTVHVHKGVVEEQQTVSAPVTHEEVDVERVPVHNQVGAAPPDAFQEEDLNIPLQGEQLVAGKQVVEAEEVRLRKRQVQEEEQVTGTVRREDIEVDQPNQYTTGATTTSTAQSAPLQSTTETMRTAPMQGTVVSGTTSREAGTYAESGTEQGTTYRIEAEPIQETTFEQTGGDTVQGTTSPTGQAGGAQGAARQGAQNAQQGAGEAKGKLDSMIDGAADKLLGRDH